MPRVALEVACHVSHRALLATCQLPLRPQPMRHAVRCMSCWGWSLDEILNRMITLGHFDALDRKHLVNCGLLGCAAEECRLFRNMLRAGLRCTNERQRSSRCTPLGAQHARDAVEQSTGRDKQPRSRAMPRPAIQCVFRGTAVHPPVPRARASPRGRTCTARCRGSAARPNGPAHSGT